MIEVRLAKKDETARQKEIWKLCFGDNEAFIDFYYANRYKEDDTVLLLYEGQISAMLTMIPVRLITSDNRSLNSAMLYAIATHPDYQNRGFATKLMNFSEEYLTANDIRLSILVPAEKHLFDFYRKQGYQDGFYCREALVTAGMVDRLPNSKTVQGTISPTTPLIYNSRRERHLTGRLHLAYADEEIAYQKKLSQLSGSDIYAIDIEEVQGCAVIERIFPGRVLIKEILLPEEYIPAVLKQIARLSPANQYIVRTPAFLGESLEGTINPFGMVRKQREIDLEIRHKDPGYLGLAFD